MKQQAPGTGHGSGVQLVLGPWNTPPRAMQLTSDVTAQAVFGTQHAPTPAQSVGEQAEPAPKKLPLAARQSASGSIWQLPPGRQQAPG